VRAGGGRAGALRYAADGSLLGLFVNFVARGREDLFCGLERIGGGGGGT
jgi:hypothetical protein